MKTPQATHQITWKNQSLVHWPVKQITGHRTSED